MVLARNHAPRSGAGVETVWQAVIPGRPEAGRSNSLIDKNGRYNEREWELELQDKGSELTTPYAGVFAGKSIEGAPWVVIAAASNRWRSLALSRITHRF
jgi:hypothetical protein